MEDAAIIALYWSRDEAAIAETDRKYGPYCRAIAQNILTIREDAEECIAVFGAYRGAARRPAQPVLPGQLGGVPGSAVLWALLGGGTGGLARLLRRPGDSV